MLGNELGEGPDSGHLHHLEQLGARLLEVLTQRLGLLDALGRENLLEHGNAATAGCSGTGCRLQGGHIGGALTDGRADRPLVTALHEQICASSGSAPTPISAPDGAMREAGSAGSSCRAWAAGSRRH